MRLPAFRHRNFRRYAVGQLASIGGTWMQNVALAWLVLDVTDSGVAVGLVTAAQFLPSVFLGAWAGAVADRFDARKVVLILQIVLAAQALAVAVVVFIGAESLWLLCVMTLWTGAATAFDPPVRQTLMNELVGDAELPNAIATNSAIVQLGLIVGPAIGAVLINTVGIAWCFAINACSYAVMFVAIAAIRTAEMIRRPKPVGVDSSVRAGFTYLRTRPDIELLLVVLGLSCLLAYRLEVLLPLLARRLGGGSGLFATLTVVRGCGALVASLYLASHFGKPSLRLLRNSLLLLAGSLELMAIPVRAIVIVAAFTAGIGMMTSVVSTLSLTQLLSNAEYRGRLIAAWFVVMAGGVVIGSVLSGALADLIGVQPTMALAGLSLVWLVTAVGGRLKVPSASTQSDAPARLP